MTYEKRMQVGLLLIGGIGSFALVLIGLLK